MEDPFRVAEVKAVSMCVTGIASVGIPPLTGTRIKITVWAR